MHVTPPCSECGLPVVKLASARKKNRLEGYIRCVATACWNSATAIIGDVPLCGDHQRTVASAIGITTGLEGILRTVPNFVYYLTWPNVESIKIGTTQSLHRRLAALTRASGKPQLLVVETGGYSVERSRHAKFATLRTEGTELFRPAPILLDHIENLRRQEPRGLHMRAL